MLRQRALAATSRLTSPLAPTASEASTATVIDMITVVKARAMREGLTDSLPPDHAGRAEGLAFPLL